MQRHLTPPIGCVSETCLASEEAGSTSSKHALGPLLTCLSVVTPHHMDEGCMCSVNPWQAM